MTHQITVNVVTNYADEWFDTIEDADKYISTMDEDEEVHEYLVYVDGVWEPDYPNHTRHYYTPDDLCERQVCPNWQHYGDCDTRCPRYCQGNCPCDKVRLSNGERVPFLPARY